MSLSEMKGNYARKSELQTWDGNLKGTAEQY